MTDPENLSEASQLFDDYGFIEETPDDYPQGLITSLSNLTSDFIGDVLFELMGGLRNL